MRLDKKRDENLTMTSSDFNYILGLILGKTNIDGDDLEFTFNIQLSKEASFTYDLNHLLAPESKVVFDNVEDHTLNGIDIKITEDLFDTKVQSKYDVYEYQDEHNKTYHAIRAPFKFRSTGPINFLKIIEESTNRINHLSVGMVRNGYEH